MSFQNCVLLLLIFVSSCRQEDAKVPVIDIDKAEQHAQSISLSQIADSVYYIRLITPDSVLLTDQFRIQLTPDHLLMKDQGTQSLYLFTAKGRFINRISSNGSDPSSYEFLSDAVIDETHQRIFILDAAKQRVMALNLQGDYLQSFSIENKPVRMALMPGKKLLLFTPTGGMDKLLYPHLLIYNYEGELMAEHFLPEKLERQDYFGHSVLYSLHGSRRLWHTGADTLLLLDEAGKLSPTYALYSSRLMPQSCRFNKNEFKNHQREYRQVHQVFETDHYVFLDALLNGMRAALVYDKTTGGCYRLTHPEPALGNAFNGFVNDLDGGIPFWPSGQVNEQYLYNIIRPASFLKVAAGNAQKDITATSNLLHQQFIHLTNNLKEFDNPVIQVIRMR